MQARTSSHSCTAGHMKTTFTLFVILFFRIAFSVPPAFAMPAVDPSPAAARLPLKSMQDAVNNGQRLILFFYTIDDPRANDAAALMQELYMQRRQYNFELTGIALNADRPDEVKAFNTARGLAFPVIRDDGGTLAEQFNMKNALGFVLFNEQGRQIGYRQAAHTPAHMSLKQQWQAYLGAQLNMLSIPDDQPVLGLKPAVPSFEAETINAKKVSVSKLHRDKPLVLVIFSPRCINCVNELDFLNSLYTEELKGRFEILALSLMPQEPTANFVRDNGYTFPAVADQARRTIALFPTFSGSVPIAYFINPQGEIEYVHIGFSNDLKDVYRMQLRKLAGMDNPPLLVKDGYSGEQRCTICHEQQHLQWSLTGHAAAFSSLQRKGATGKQDCVACHVTGYEQPGGYQPGRPNRQLHNVQCESCHGPGYQSCSAYTGKKNDKKNAPQWKALCVQCHTEKESLNFVFARRFSRVLHTAMPKLKGLDRNERLALLNRSEKRHNPFDNPARYVGADACKACHTDQYQHWQSTLHASLKTDNATQPDRLYRFVTGSGSEGGYPEPGRDGVQCEACHGPAERHVQQPETKGHDYIVGLGAECPSCVVEQICRTCHNLEDSPEFDFERAIDRVRHPKPAR